MITPSQFAFLQYIACKCSAGEPLSREESREVAGKFDLYLRLQVASYADPAILLPDVNMGAYAQAEIERRAAGGKMLDLCLTTDNVGCDPKAAARIHELQAGIDAALLHLVDYGRLELGTSQSKALIAVRSGIPSQP